ncbi:MAG: hypothetical protein WBC35_07580 [Saprospiraceae bacterium]
MNFGLKPPWDGQGLPLYSVCLVQIRSGGLTMDSSTLTGIY